VVYNIRHSVMDRLMMFTITVSRLWVNGFLIVIFTVWVDEILISFYEIVNWLDDAELLLFSFMLLKVSGKVLLDRNTLYSSIHRIYGYCYCSLFISLFTVYTITVLLLSLYCPSILSNMDIDCLTELDNVKDNLHWDWGNRWKR